MGQYATWDEAGEEGVHLQRIGDSHNSQDSQKRLPSHASVSDQDPEPEVSGEEPSELPSPGVIAHIRPQL